MPNILVIDDDPSVRTLVADVLGMEGHDVRCAPDGMAGLLMIDDERPDCIVLDAMMPGLTGHEVLRLIREADGDHHLPVVMLTAASDDSQAWRAWSQGVDYFLAKPFDPSELLRYLDYLFCPSTATRDCG